jgi:hypothetical protein
MKRHTFWFAAIVILLAMIGFNLAPRAQERTNTDYIMPLGYCQLSVTTVVGISTCSGGIPARTVWAVLCAETANIRWRDDGTNATTSVGMPLNAGSCMYYSGTMSALTVVAVSGSPVLDICFYSGAPRT